MSSQTDLADAFCVLYDRFSHEWTVGAAEALLLQGFDPERLVRQGLVSEGLSTAALEAGLADPLTAMRLALSIDSVLGEAHPSRRAASCPRTLDQYLERHEERSNLATEAISGALLYRFAAPSRGDDLDSVFGAVVRVAESVWVLIDRTKLESDVDLLAPILSADGQIRIACLPFATASDLLVERVSHGGRAWYRIEARADTLSRLIPEALAALDDSGAHLAVLPEETLNVDLLNAWITALSETAPPPNSHLEWILVGTGPVGESVGSKPTNTAVILSRDGRQVATQLKRHRYELPSSTIERWGLADDLGGETDLDEYIDPGHRLTMIESRLGRVAVLICEDLGRRLTEGHQVAQFSPWLLAVPVLDQGLEPGRWEDFAARDWWNSAGAVSVVSNSLVIPGRMGIEVAGVACLFGGASLEVQSAGSPLDIALFEVPGNSFE